MRNVRDALALKGSACLSGLRQPLSWGETQSLPSRLRFRIPTLRWRLRSGRRPVEGVELRVVSKWLILSLAASSR